MSSVQIHPTYQLLPLGPFPQVLLLARLSPIHLY